MKPIDFINQYENALASQNWGNVAPLIAENAVVTFSNGLVNKGKSAIQTAFQNNFNIIKSEKYAIKNVDWIMENEMMAVFTFDYHWGGYINEKYMEGAGRGTSVLINENNKWILLSEHLGPMPNG